MPALYNLGAGGPAAGIVRHRRRARGAAVTAEAFRARPARGRPGVLARKPAGERRRGTQFAPAASTTSAAISTTRRRTSGCARALDRARRARAALEGNRLFYLAVPPDEFSHHPAPAARRALPASMPHERAVHARDHREAVRPRPRDRRATLNRARGPRARRIADLSHRPLPRQGNGPEHPGVPLRQQHLRAAVEPQVRRPRADHGGRDRGRRARAASSTSRPACCATSSRTTCSRCCR